MDTCTKQKHNRNALTAGNASAPRLWIVLTSCRSVARDQERSGYPGRLLSRYPACKVSMIRLVVRVDPGSAALGRLVWDDYKC